MEGCLDSSEQGFLLTAQKQTVELNGDVDFKPHVGHRVSVSGDQQGPFAPRQGSTRTRSPSS